MNFQGSDPAAGTMQILPRPDRPIAVVDDNSDDRFFLKREIGHLFGDMPVISFQGGAALLHYLQEHYDEHERPWLILLDLHMAGMDGLRTLEVLRRRANLADIPVVIVSATMDRREIRAALGSGALAFLPKPVTRLEFIRLLNNGPKKNN